MAGSDALLKEDVVYLEGPMGAGKTRYLLDRCVELLKTHPSRSVLVLCSNHARQELFKQALLARLDKPMGQLPVYTYMGFVRNWLQNIWPLVESRIGQFVREGQSCIRPRLFGMEETELILQHLVNDCKRRNPNAFADFPGSERSLLRQLVRRIRLRSENGLSRPEMTRRSVLLNEICRAETAEVEKAFDRISYRLRVLDINKQLDIFRHLLTEAEHEGCLKFQADLRHEIRHLLVDDVDETIPAQQQLIQFLAPTLDSLALAADTDGGSRRGYLNAYPYDWVALKTLRPGQTIVLRRFDQPLEEPLSTGLAISSSSSIVDDSGRVKGLAFHGIYQAAQTLLANWKIKGNDQETYAPLPHCVTLKDDFITRTEMLDQVVSDVFQYLSQGYSPGDLCLVMPTVDIIGLHHLQQKLGAKGVPVQWLAGTKKPSDNPKCRAYLLLLQLANAKRWALPLSVWEMKTVLTHVLQLPLQARDLYEAILQSWQEALIAGSEETVIPSLGSLSCALSESYAQRYQQLEAWLKLTQRQPFHVQLYTAFEHLMAPFATEADRFSDLKRLIESYERQRQIWLGLGSQLTDGNTDVFDPVWLMQAKTGAVADSPEMPDLPDSTQLVIGTPQKIIDMSARRKIQFWLDVSSREWCRSDNAPLYHAWVHSAVWRESDAQALDPWDAEFNDRIIRERAGHITRTLMLLAEQQVCCYASDLDDLGDQNTGMLAERIVLQTPHVTSLNQPSDAVVLRPDQQPVLAYRQGTMAIAAVPGAGKTFINVELILHLIREVGVEADQILALTYMDSAAQTLLGRVKHKLTALGMAKKLPVICTIHSLALRILTENEHCIRLGLMPDEIQIVEEYRQKELIQQIAQQTECSSLEAGIKAAKAAFLSPEHLTSFLARRPNDERLQAFSAAYRLYGDTMRQNQWMDFDDLIVQAIRLLETQADIRAYYQSQFRYIIEDEAQDSSRMLQRLIALLGGEQPNLIRTGDTNQSITTTFSSADPMVFREFIHSADHVVKMDRSGRCAPEVIDLANRWMQFCMTHLVLKDTFQPMIMQPIEGRNPTLLKLIEAGAYQSLSEETRALAENVQQMRSLYPESSMAVLVSTNEQVDDICAVLQKAQVPAISLSQDLNLTPVFSVLLAWLKLFDAAMDRVSLIEAQLQLYHVSVEAGLLAHTAERRTFLEQSLLVYESLDRLRELDDQVLLQLHFDWLDFSREALRGDVPALLVKMTNCLFDGVAERSNGYLCALLAKEILDTHGHLAMESPMHIVVSQFSRLRQQKTRWKKSFSQALLHSSAPFVQVMTLHKSKGQEFDLVWMPYLQTELFPDLMETGFRRRSRDEIEKGKLALIFSQVAEFHQTGQLPKPTPFDKEAHLTRQYQAVMEEKARLFYVGLTRAKRGLFLSAHHQNDRKLNNKKEPQATQPALAFRYVVHCLSSEGATSAESAPLEPNKSGGKVQMTMSSAPGPEVVDVSG